MVGGTEARRDKDPACSHSPKSEKAAWILSASWISRCWGFVWFWPAIRKENLRGGERPADPECKKTNRGAWMDQDCGHSCRGGWQGGESGGLKEEDQEQCHEGPATNACCSNGQVHSLGTVLCPALSWHDPDLSNLQDLSFLTRDWTQVLGIESTES